MMQPDDLWEEMTPVLTSGEEDGFVLTTVVATSASAPRPAGTQMAVLAGGAVVGSLSGGCIEADVVARAEQVAATGQPVLQDYGYSDATALGVGLTCGGSLRVYLEPVPAADFAFFRELTQHLQAGTPVAAITALTGPAAGWRGMVSPGAGPVCGSGIGEELADAAGALVRERRSGVIAGTDVGSPTDYFVRSFGGPDHLVIFGSNAFAAALSRLAKTVGYRVTVCDARATFTTRERFPAADEIIVRQPHRYLAELAVDHRTVLCAMTHDPKFDDPLLAEALRSPAQFIGAMGSRLTADERYERLGRLGFSESDLRRLHAPFGLDIGAASPEETAVSMLAEIISARQGGSNRPLTRTEGRIHEPARAASLAPLRG